MSMEPIAVTSAPSNREVLLAISIDTECDKGPEWKTRFPLSFRSVGEGIAQRLTPLFREHGLTPTYLLSPEVMQDAGSVKALGALGGCELGTHLHGEFVEPQADFAAPATSTPQIAYAPEIERRKLANLTDLFVTRFGRRPVSFRAGRFALAGRTLSFLEDLGYSVDSSVTPFRTNEFAGGLSSNFWGAPLAPYHPSVRDPRKRGRLRLLEVPVTILAPSLARWPRFLLRRLSDRASRSRPIRAIAGGTVEKLWVRPLRGTAEQLLSWADAVIGSWEARSTPVLNVMFHSVEAVAGASPYARTEDEVEGLLADLGRLFAHLHRRHRLVPVTLGELSRKVGA